MDERTKGRVRLSPGYEARAGDRSEDPFDVYTTIDVGENERIHVGQLSRKAVLAWSDAAWKAQKSDAE